MSIFISLTAINGILKETSWHIYKATGSSQKPG